MDKSLSRKQSTRHLGSGQPTTQLAIGSTASRRGATDKRQAVGDKSLYLVAYDIIKQHIVENSLPNGLVLLESKIAELLTMSREPVKRALKLLSKEGLIHEFDGRGYLVGLSGETDGTQQRKPLRLDLAAAGFRAPQDLGEMIGRFRWETIYSEIERSISRSIPFGTYRIVETAVTERFRVSRTVAREVLSRLRDRGLIEKNRWATWIAGPLTSRSVDDCFELRIQLEPAALVCAAARHDVAALRALWDDFKAVIAKEHLAVTDLSDIRRHFDDELLSGCVNRRLMSVIEDCRLTNIISELFYEFFGTVDCREGLTEQRLVVEHLCRGSIHAATAALAAHLERDRQRTKERLKVLAVVPDPETEPYLKRIY